MTIILSVVFITLTIIIAHVIAPKEYNWHFNTISELAAQKYRYRAVMQVGFAGFGALLSAGIIMEWINYIFKAEYVPILVYALAVMLSGFFSTAPFSGGLAFSVKESKFHSLFAQLAGFSFSLGIVMFLIFTDNLLVKAVHFGFFLFVILVSFSFGKIHAYRGVLQRILYLGSFVWIILFPGGFIH